MAWETTQITTDSGLTAEAQAPVIISASRATDIPAFYADWFFSRLRTGYSGWVNPFSGKKSYISYDRARLIVFWSKNPEPLLSYLPELRTRGINSFIQFTLNDYAVDGLEPGVPPLEQRIDTFRRLVDALGFGRVVWRFDPLVLTGRIDVPYLLEKLSAVGDRLQGYTEKLVFSFADIAAYRGVAARMREQGIASREFGEAEMLLFARELNALNRKWGFEIATCGEKIDLSSFGIEHSRCIDDRLMIKYFSEDEALMGFLGWPGKYPGGSLFPQQDCSLNKDKGQRALCGCVASKDIGAYGTCAHGCVYCYANRQGAASAHAKYRRITARGPDFSDTLDDR